MNSWIKEKDCKKLNMIEQKLFRWLTPKTLAVLLSVGYFLSIVPLLWVGMYNVASADDFGEASNTHLTWMATHNLFATIASGITRAVGDWFHWMGYYTCNLLMAISPITFGEKHYWIVAFMMIGALSLSTIYLLYMLFVRVFHFEKYSSWSVIFLMLFATVQCMPYEGRVEAFYWYSGAVNYIFVHSLGNLFYGLLLSLYVHREEKQRGRIIGTSILAFFVGGGNQMTMLNVAVVLFLTILLFCYHKKWKNSKMMIAPFALFYMGMLLNVVAPGNFVRSSGANGMNPVKAIFISLHYGLDRCISLWTTWPVAALFLLIAVLAWKMTGRVSFAFPCPLLVVLLAYCLTSAMMTPPLFAVGNMEAGRIQALTYVMYILTSTISIVYVTGWFRWKICHKDEHPSKTLEAPLPSGQMEYSMTQKWAVLGTLAMLLLGGALSVIPTPEYFTFTEAIADLSGGDAKAYYEAHCERIRQYHSDIDGVITVSPITNRPKLLFFSDIKLDAGDWENRSLARYLGIEGVVLGNE